MSRRVSGAVLGVGLVVLAGVAPRSAGQAGPPADKVTFRGPDGKLTTEAGEAKDSARGVELTALCDVYETSLDRAMEHAPAARRVADYRRVLDDPSIDAVLIGTPDHWHRTMTIDAVKAGKDVYVEKPISRTIEEGEAMVQAVLSSKQVVQTGTQQRSWDHFKLGKELIAAGRLGQGSPGRAGDDGPGDDRHGGTGRARDGGAGHALDDRTGRAADRGPGRDRVEGRDLSAGRASDDGAGAREGALAMSPAAPDQAHGSGQSRVQKTLSAAIATGLPALMILAPSSSV